MDALAAISRTVVRPWPCWAKSFCAASRIAARLRSDLRAFCIRSPCYILSTAIDNSKRQVLLCQHTLINRAPRRRVLSAALQRCSDDRRRRADGMDDEKVVGSTI